MNKFYIFDLDIAACVYFFMYSDNKVAAVSFESIQRM